MTLIRALALGVAVCCLTWIGVLWWWQLSGREVRESEVVFYLVALPLVLLALALALRRAWFAADERTSSLLKEKTDSSLLQAKVQQGDEVARYATRHIVHVAMVSAGGDSPADLLEAAAKGKPRPEPDRELVNEAGLPVLCARLTDEKISIEACRGDIQKLIELAEPRDSSSQPMLIRNGLLRSLAALQPPLLEQRQWLLDQALRESAGGKGFQREPSRRVVRLLLGIDENWTATEQSIATQWAQGRWAGSDDALDSHYQLQLQLAPGDVGALWIAATRSAFSAQETSSSEWLLVAAAHSGLEQQRVDALAASGRLYDARAVPSGIMLGEAAATVLMSPSNWVVPTDLPSQPVLLHRASVGVRSKPVDAAGKVDAQLLRELARDALIAAKVSAEQISALVCDADEHSQRATELYELTLGDLPHLDPLADVRALGKVTAQVGEASFLLVLGCARELAGTTGKPVLALAMADSRTRVAVVVKPDFSEEVAAHQVAAINRTS